MGFFCVFDCRVLGNDHMNGITLLKLHLIWTYNALNLMNASITFPVPC